MACFSIFSLISKMGGQVGPGGKATVDGSNWQQAACSELRIVEVRAREHGRVLNTARRAAARRLTLSLPSSIPHSLYLFFRPGSLPAPFPLPSLLPPAPTLRRAGVFLDGRGGRPCGSALCTPGEAKHASAQPQQRIERAAERVPVSKRSAQLLTKRWRG